VQANQADRRYQSLLDTPAASSAKEQASQMVRSAYAAGSRAQDSLRAAADRAEVGMASFFKSDRVLGSRSLDFGVKLVAGTVVASVGTGIGALRAIGSVGMVPVRALRGETVTFGDFSNRVSDGFRHAKIGLSSLSGLSTIATDRSYTSEGRSGERVASDNMKKVAQGISSGVDSAQSSTSRFGASLSSGLSSTMSQVSSSASQFSSKMSSIGSYALSKGSASLFSTELATGSNAATHALRQIGTGLRGGAVVGMGAAGAVLGGVFAVTTHIAYATLSVPTIIVTGKNIHQLTGFDGHGLAQKGWNLAGRGVDTAKQGGGLVSNAFSSAYAGPGYKPSETTRDSSDFGQMSERFAPREDRYSSSPSMMNSPFQGQGGPEFTAKPSVRSQSNPSQSSPAPSSDLGDPAPTARSPREDRGSVDIGLSFGAVDAAPQLVAASTTSLSKTIAGLFGELGEWID
jgi:hypothetical protein